MYFFKLYCLDDDQNIPTTASNPSELAGSSIKVTLKKTRSCSSSSSRESTQSFEVRNYTIF